MSMIRSNTLYVVHSITQVLRYILATHRLIFLHARGIIDLSQMVKLRLLSTLEAKQLQDVPAKAMVVWSWYVYKFKSHTEKFSLHIDKKHSNHYNNLYCSMSHKNITQARWLSGSYEYRKEISRRLRTSVC